MKSLRGPYLTWRLLVFASGVLVTVFLSYLALDTIRRAIEYNYLGMPAWRNEIAAQIVYAAATGLLSFICLRARASFAPLLLSLATIGIVGFTLIVAALATMNTH
jgi:hypothetical protein